MFLDEIQYGATYAEINKKKMYSFCYYYYDMDMDGITIIKKGEKKRRKKRKLFSYLQSYSKIVYGNM